jgi:hypothetical protein
MAVKKICRQIISLRKKMVSAPVFIKNDKWENCWEMAADLRAGELGSASGAG